MTYENSKYPDKHLNMSSDDKFNQGYQGIDLGKKSESYSQKMTESHSSTTPQHESDVTKAIRESMERSSSIQNSTLDLNFREVFDLAKVVINEIPVVLDKTGKTINKVVDVSKEGLNNINNFANNFRSIKDNS